MNQNCKHQWNPINPVQLICCNCNKVVNIYNKNDMSQIKFKKIFSELKMHTNHT